jgi:formylglycine-generating enzyme required for sulfatase activity
MNGFRLLAWFPLLAIAGACAAREPAPSIAAEPLPPADTAAAEPARSNATPAGMVHIPEGDFFMGCNRAVDNACSGQETPGHRLWLDAYSIDVNEVTVADYATCVKAGACSDHHLNGFEPEGAPYQDSRGFPVPGAAPTVPDWPTCNWGKAGREDHPINCVSWNHANTYCAWAGKRLPTEAEWEKAARGTDGRKYPWGNEDATCDFTVTHDYGHAKGCDKKSSWPVGSHPRGASPYGAMDMAGNVWEWVSDWYDPEYLHHQPAKNPQGPSTGTMKAGKGGCWGSGNPWNLRPSSRMGYRPEYRSNHRLGFRCARSTSP